MAVVCGGITGSLEAKRFFYETAPPGQAAKPHLLGLRGGDRTAGEGNFTAAADFMKR